MRRRGERAGNGVSGSRVGGYGILDAVVRYPDSPSLVIGLTVCISDCTEILAIIYIPKEQEIWDELAAVLFAIGIQLSVSAKYTLDPPTVD